MVLTKLTGRTVYDLTVPTFFSGIRGGVYSSTCRSDGCVRPIFL